MFTNDLHFDLVIKGFTWNNINFYINTNNVSYSDKPEQLTDAEMKFNITDSHNQKLFQSYMLNISFKHNKNE